METLFIEHLVASKSEYDEVREIAEENTDLAEFLYDRLVSRLELPDYLEPYAYAYVFEGYDPIPENE